MNPFSVITAFSSPDTNCSMDKLLSGCFSFMGGVEGGCGVFRFAIPQVFIYTIFLPCRSCPRTLSCFLILLSRTSYLLFLLVYRMYWIFLVPLLSVPICSYSFDDQQFCPLGLLARDLLCVWVELIIQELAKRLKVTSAGS